MDAQQHIEPPEHLSAEAREFFNKTLPDIVPDNYSIALLSEASRIIDELARVREKLRADGQFFSDRFGKPRSHPALKVQADLRNQLNVIFRSLGLHRPLPADEQKKFAW